MQQKGIHWFPGHMQKAMREIGERIKVIDVVIELLDARAPLSSRNEFLFNLTKNKKRLLLLTKSDLADKRYTGEWENYFKSLGYDVLSSDLNNRDIVKEISKRVELLGKDKHEREIRRGMKPQPIRTMIIGIPNVGKSTLINKLAKRNAASVQNTPGHTKAQQWIKVGNSFELLDTPGVLPAYYEKKDYAINLALIGSIKQDILPQSDLADYLCTFLKKNYQSSFFAKYDITSDMLEDNQKIFLQIAKRRGLLKNSELDIEKAEVLLLKEFKDGIIDCCSLERVS